MPAVHDAGETPAVHNAGKMPAVHDAGWKPAVHNSIIEYMTKCILVFMICAGPLLAEPPYVGYSDYQIVTDSEFNAKKYFSKMKSYGVNFQRIWALGLSGADFEHLPFAKKGRLYNLNKIDKTYLERLRSVLQSARSHDQQVMLTLFDHWSLGDRDIFPRTPWFYKNNSDRLLKKPFPDFYDHSNARLKQIHENYVRTVVSATAEFHPIYEIMNEGTLKSGCGLLSQWHQQVARWILEEAPDAEIAVNVSRECLEIVEQPWVDMISFHGGFWLEHGICNVVGQFSNLNKSILIDTDAAQKERDNNKALRKWALEALECGASFNHKDDIYTLDRQALRILREVKSSMAGSEARPQNEGR